MLLKQIGTNGFKHQLRGVGHIWGIRHIWEHTRLEKVKGPMNLIGAIKCGLIFGLRIEKPISLML